MRNQSRICLQYTFKIINSILTVLGLGIISYSLWILKKWQIHQHGLLCLHEYGALPRPWFIYILLTMGIVLCFTTLLGHVAVETGSGVSISIYIFLVTLLLVIQGVTFLYVILKKNWKDYIPEDPTDQFKKFIKHNISICKCIGLIAILVQALTIILAFILQAMEPESDPERTDEDRSCRSNIKQSFLVESFSRLNSLPKLFTWSDVSSNGTHQYEDEEANFLTSQVEQRIPFLNGSQAEQ